MVYKIFLFKRASLFYCNDCGYIYIDLIHIIDIGLMFLVVCFFVF